VDKILDKLSSYNIFNYLFPGAVFCVVADRYFTIPLLQDSIIDGLFLYYFVGLVVSRFGSIAIEPLLKKFGIIQYSDYADFVEASKADPKIEILSESNNMYRSLLSAAILLSLIIVTNQLVIDHPGLGEYVKYALLPALIVLFGFSYKKQADYISKRVSANKEL
jgi:hypothetical protein